MNNNECNFWYWYNVTYILAGLAISIIMVTAVVALRTFFSDICKCKQMFNNNDNEDEFEMEYIKQNNVAIQFYDTGFILCLILLMISLIITFVVDTFVCHDNILIEQYISTILVIIGSISYHIVILTLHLAWLATKYNKISKTINITVSVCIITHWFLMSIIAYLLNYMVQTDDQILIQFAHDNNYAQFIQNLNTKLQDSDNYVIIISAIIVFCATISDIVIWIFITNRFRFKSHNNQKTNVSSKNPLHLTLIDIDTAINNSTVISMK